MDSTLVSSSLSLTDVVSTAVQIPGVKVERDSFLREIFKDTDPAILQDILEQGPVNSGCEKKLLRQKAHKLIQARTAFSTSASFVAGLPGGLAMAASIPADLLQFYGVALRMAQELAYLYGEPNLWEKDLLDRDKITNQLILYCGVMLGASGAAQSVRILSSALAKQALKKLPQQALTKSFYYPIIKSIARFFGVSMTKNTFAKGVSKTVPILGGVVSGGITLATMAPMGTRLADTLEQAHFDYSEETFQQDWNQVLEVADQEQTADTVSNDIGAEKPAVKPNLSGWLQKAKASFPSAKKTESSAMDEILKAKQLLDQGVLTEQEFSQIKAKFLAEISKSSDK